MAGSDWDNTVDTLKATTPAMPVEHTLWTLTKTGRTASAVVRPHPHGQELRFVVDGELMWSMVFRDGRGTVLGEVAEMKQREFEERGWLAP